MEAERYHAKWFWVLLPKQKYLVHQDETNFS